MDELETGTLQKPRARATGARPPVSPLPGDDPREESRRLPVSGRNAPLQALPDDVCLLPGCWHLLGVCALQEYVKRLPALPTLPAASLRASPPDLNSALPPHSPSGRYSVFKIHWLMAALAFTKSVSLLFHSVSNQGPVVAQGWDGEMGHLSAYAPCPAQLSSQGLPSRTIRWSSTECPPYHNRPPPAVTLPPPRHGGDPWRLAVCISLPNHPSIPHFCP